MARLFPRMVSGRIYYTKTFTGSEFIFESKGVLGQRTAHTYSFEIHIGCKDEDNVIVDTDDCIEEIRLATIEELSVFFKAFPLLIMDKEEEKDKEETKELKIVYHPFSI